MRSAIRWFMPAILFTVACSGGIEVQTTSSSTASTGGTGGVIASSSVGSGGIVCPGTGGAGDTGGGDMGGGGADDEASFCHQPFYPSVDVCQLGCVMQYPKGGTPTILYEYVDETSFDIDIPLGATDGYVLAIATWGAKNWSDPGAVSGVIEIPRTGEPPVIVDTFPSGAWWIYATAIMGDDGYLYYGVGPYQSSPSSGELLLRRVSTTHLGEPATAIASVPGSYWDKTFVVGDDHVYIAGAWGISRVPKGGGALETVVEHDPAPLVFPNSIAVNDGFVYYSVYSETCATYLVQRTPVTGGPAEAIAVGAPRMVFAGSPASLFVLEDKTMRRFDASLSTATLVLSTHTAQYQTIEVVGTQVYVTAECLPPIPDGPSQGFVRSYDTVTGTTGFLEDDPDYPFVPGPTGILHDATGETLFLIY
ncbi:Hypothetical protein A7982_05291 [Minicystis rosea]|nr:Hypothetical protein A7982_05291 [Minicystis rosea]